MDIQFYGANCVTITTKNVRLVFDDNLVQLGAKPVSREGDVCLFTAAHPEPVKGTKMTIDMAGEYEVSGVNILGIQARAHMDGDSERNATMYKVTAGDVRVLVIGHIYPKLSESKLEKIGLVDILLVPVGGTGYTMDPTGALQVVKEIEPKVFVPTHYADSELQYEVPQQSLEDALKAFGMEPKETTKKYQFKPAEMSDTTQLVILEKA
ncbi:MBL fold metallo-hydrolase [Candidatus Saccharibacteria bacterium]|nr:MAG: MBL fold metallo-hydrolase [Candidatus Saccharibacteria bacterium]